MDKYEYKYLNFSSRDYHSLITNLNQFGTQGWHVVAATPNSYDAFPPSTSDGYRNIRYDIILERKLN